MIGLWMAAAAAIAVATNGPPAVAPAKPATAPVIVPASATADLLPPPPQSDAGEVPLSSPVAPMAPGMSPWTLSLSVLGGVADPFYDKVATLLSVRRGFGHFGFELFGGRAYSWASAALSVCTSAAACGAPSASQLQAAPGDLGWLAGASAVWEAGIGKISFGGMAAHHFAVDLSLGAAAMQYAIVEKSAESLWSPGLRATAGVQGELTPQVSLSVDLQDLVYPTNIRSSWQAQNQLFAGASIAWHPGGP